MQITETAPNRWTVISDTSGKTYEVRHRTYLDEMGSMYFRWTCTCPARKNPCKHIAAVEKHLFDAGESYCAEAEERTV